MFSTFLFLLPFTLSAPTSEDLLFSFIYYPSDYFLINFLLFPLEKGPGLYVWTIPLVDESSDISEDYAENLKGPLANTLSIYWSIQPNRVTFELLSSNLSNLLLDTSKTYIILKIEYDMKCEAYYWMGTESGLAKRQITARLVVRMMFELRIGQYELIHLSREEEGKESQKFQDLFAETNVSPIPKLFKVTGQRGQLIKEVPLIYNELNGTDVFVIHKKKKILIWNPNPDMNHNKMEKALALATYIQNAHDGIRITIKSKNMESSKQFNDSFLRGLKDKPESCEFPENNLSWTTDEEFETKRNENLRMFQYSIVDNWIILYEFVSRPLKLENFETNNTYTIYNSETGNIFIYIPENVIYAQIEQAMAAAEIINWYTDNNKWRKITVIRHTDRLPANFIVNFPDIENIIKQ